MLLCGKRLFQDDWRIQWHMEINGIFVVKFISALLSTRKSWFLSAVFGALSPHKSNDITKSNKAMTKPLFSRCLEELMTINNNRVAKKHFYANKWTLFLLDEEILTSPKCGSSLVGTVGIVLTSVWVWVDAKPCTSPWWMGWELCERSKHPAVPGSVTFPPYMVTLHQKWAQPGSLCVGRSSVSCDLKAGDCFCPVLSPSSPIPAASRAPWCAFALDMWPGDVPEHRRLLHTCTTNHAPVPWEEC